MSATRVLDAREIGAIFAGGCVGGVLRVALAQTWDVDAGTLPWPTLVVNLLGSLLLGWLAARSREIDPDESYAHPLLATGFCGAFTTFATLQVELIALLDNGHVLLAAVYLAISLIGGLAAVRAGGRLRARR